MSTKLFVGSIPWKATDQDLNELFANYGNVLSANILTDRETGRSRGFGFVEMESDDEAQAAIANLHEKDFMGRNIVVNVAKPKE